MKDDELLMAEEIGRLRTLNDTLKDEIKGYRYKIYFDKAVIVFIVAPVMLTLSTLIFRALWCKSDITHCYVDTSRGDGIVRLRGNIEGMPDDDLGGFSSAVEATKAAQLIDCPMWRRK